MEKRSVKHTKRKTHRMKKFGKNLVAFMGMYLALFMLTMAGCAVCILTTGGF